MLKSSAYLALAAALAFSAGPAGAVKLTPISTPFSGPIGIDYHQPTNSVVMSANYPSGQPSNFVRVLQDGTQIPFSAINGYTDEIKIATVRSGNPGGFTTGELFVGNGIDGEIMRITANGASSSLFTSLPGAGNGLFRGSLYVDRTGVWGGDLIASTTGGEVWRVNSSGIPTFVADVDTHLEGMITVPNDASKYGPLAGKVIAGAENQGLLYAFDTTGAYVSYSLGVNVEDIDLIGANENFFGINYGTSRILGAPASDFAGLAGDILLTQETGFAGSGLFRLTWNGSALQATQLALDAGSAAVGQWEHVTFAAAGIKEIPPAPVPEPASLVLSGLGLAAVIRRRTSARRA